MARNVRQSHYYSLIPNKTLFERLSLKQGTGNRGIGMGTGNGNGE